MHKLIYKSAITRVVSGHIKGCLYAHYLGQPFGCPIILYALFIFLKPQGLGLNLIWFQFLELTLHYFLLDFFLPRNGTFYFLNNSSFNGPINKLRNPALIPWCSFLGVFGNFLGFCPENHPIKGLVPSQSGSYSFLWIGMPRLASEAPGMKIKLPLWAPPNPVFFPRFQTDLQAVEICGSHLLHS